LRIITPKDIAVDMDECARRLGPRRVCATMGFGRCLDGRPLNLGENAVRAAVFNGFAFCYEM
jgi:hypothetical protein